MDARSRYEVGRVGAARDVTREDGRIRIIGMARILAVAAVLGLVGALVWTEVTRSAWLGVIGLVGLFVVLVVLHQRTFARRGRAAAVQRFHDRGIARLSGKWTEHARDGAAFGSVDHPYSGDLDVFGKASLFQLMNAAETPFGEQALAAFLAGPSRAADVDARAWAEGLSARQAAVKELAAKLEFRERLSAVAHVVSSERPDPTPFVDWAEQATPLGPSAASRVLAFVLPVLAVGAMGTGAALGLPRLTWVTVVAAELVFLWTHRVKTASIIGAASSKEGTLGRFTDVFAVVEGETFEAPELRRLQDELRAGGTKVTREMAALGRIIGFVDARQNEVFRLFISPVLLWDFHCAVALDRWRTRAGPRVRGWFATLGQLEALASLAGFAFEGPDRCWPELADHACFEGHAMGHPLLAAGQRVDNDVVLPRPAWALVVTGSNMSGKSTLLRAIGLNAVLAMAGAPVCATRLSIGKVAVATSMRVSDSLEAGISHFLAELKRIKRVVDMARERPPVLFLLDEILHGTNSRERLIGARAIVRSLTDLGAFGAVSTHDLGLAEPVPELSGRVENVHFQEQVDAAGVMTFDYRLRAGVVQSSNALRLMRAVGLDVPEDG
jgi:hypothetical protein